MNGTSAWMAPELRDDKTVYSFGPDIYALGIVMWEMASGQTPVDRSHVLNEELDNVPVEYQTIMRKC